MRTQVRPPGTATKPAPCSGQARAASVVARALCSAAAAAPIVNASTSPGKKQRTYNRSRPSRNRSKKPRRKGRGWFVLFLRSEEAQLFRLPTSESRNWNMLMKSR